MQPNHSAEEERKRPRRWLLPVVVIAVVALLLIWILFPRGPGNASLDFTLPEATSVPPGRPWHLADHLAQGKPVLVEFILAVSVTPVQRMVPVLRDLQNGTYGDEIQIVSVAVYFPDVVGGIIPTLDSVAALAQAYNTTWPYLVEGNGTHGVRDLYNVTGVPTFVIVKTDGSVAWRRAGSMDLPTLEAGVRQAI